MGKGGKKGQARPGLGSAIQRPSYKYSKAFDGTSMTSLYCVTSSCAVAVRRPTGDKAKKAFGLLLIMWLTSGLPVAICVRMV